jgi:hypothetical protein
MLKVLMVYQNTLRFFTTIMAMLMQAFAKQKILQMRIRVVALLQV